MVKEERETVGHYAGLTAAEVEKSRREHGDNVITPPEREPLWKQFLVKFTEPLIVILLVAGVMSVGIAVYEYFGLGEGRAVFFEPVGIFVAIMLATGLAFFFEHDADKEFNILNKVNDDEPVEVVREGNVTLIARRDVVVDDVVMLASGAEVPADGVLLTATSLIVDESSLTGEPSCSKTTDASRFDPEATFPSNHVLRGTKVMEGHAVFRVTAVGDSTENGRVFTAAQIDNNVKTPLNIQLDRLGKQISWASYTVAFLVVVGRLVMYFTHIDASVTWPHIFASVLQTFMIAVTLIVVAVPEGLPMAVTLSLAYSMRRMLKTNNLVRKLHACETMGAATVICTDKTGTLTLNRMSVREALFPDKSLMPVVSEGIAVNSTAELDMSSGVPQAVGNPTEGALLMWLADQGSDYRQLKHAVDVVEELPFSSERKYMATVVGSAVTGGRMLYVKGAPEIVMRMCGEVAGDMSRESIEERLTAFQQQAMRTLAFACRRLEEGETAISNGIVACGDMTFLGVVAIADPVREDVPPAIDECLAAGIKVKIVTGDTPATAMEIARQIGLLSEGEGGSSVITGPEFAALSDEEALRRVQEIKIIARARPMDKKRLVEMLQQNGEVVAVTGDGTNDAPALKAAQVGLSMGDGTAVAKEASDITIIDNSFSSIGKAVMWGRSLYRNIQRFLLFQLTVNVSACLIVLAGAFLGTSSPLTVTQMLWVNLIMDTFGAMALASLPPSQSVMRESPRSQRAHIITRGMAYEILGVGVGLYLLLLPLLCVVA